MISGTPPEARWTRDEPRRGLEAAQADRLIHAAMGPRRISAIHPLTGGFRNANFKVEFADSSAPVVLRLYEHDPSLCQKEIDLIRMVAGSVPVPEIIHAEPRGLEGLPAFVVMRFVEGLTLRDLRHTVDAAALAEAGFSLGQTVASIGRFSFEKPGWISAGPRATTPLLEGRDPVPRFIDLCLGTTNLQHRIAPELRDRLHALVWEWAPQLAALDSESRLVHGDLSHRNLLVRRIDGKWRVAAVLDWEFAVSSSPLADLGHFLLRHERRSMDHIEPSFVQGYLDNGGTLHEGWRNLARLLDLIAVCESLTHDRLPETAENELVELVRTAVQTLEL